MTDIPPEERPGLDDLARLSPDATPPRRRRLRTSHATLLVAAAVAGAVAWLVLAGGGGGTAPTERAQTRAPQPGPSATPVRVFYVVSGVDSCLRMRAQPSERAPILDCLRAGVRVRSDGRHATREGRLWRHVYDHLRKRWAWAAAEFLTPA